MPIVYDTFQFDSSKIKRRTDGGIELLGRIARTGIQDYKDESGNDIKVYRPESEVFSKESMDSFKGIPITDRHPRSMINSANFRTYAMGHVGYDIQRDGDFLVAPIVINDESLIYKVTAKDHVELSSGYFVEYDLNPGKTPNGEVFDRSQKNIRGNHVGIGPRNWARAGKDAVLLMDGNEKIDFGDDMDKTLEEKVKELQTELDKAKAVNDAQKAEIEDLKKKTVFDEKKFSEMVSKKLETIEKAKKICDTFDSKLTDNEIIRSVVKSKGIAVDGKSDDYILARFDILLEKAEADSKAKDSAGQARVMAKPNPSETDQKGSVQHVSVTDVLYTRQILG